MTFRVGQKVVCVSVANDPSWWGENRPCVGGVYTIRAVRLSQDLDTKGEPACLLAEIFNSFNPFSGKEPGFLQSRFRPAVERKTDITVFTEILRKATKPAPATPVALQP